MDKKGVYHTTKTSLPMHQSSSKLALLIFCVKVEGYWQLAMPSSGCLLEPEVHFFAYFIIINLG